MITFDKHMDQVYLNLVEDLYLKPFTPYSDISNEFEESGVFASSKRLFRRRDWDHVVPADAMEYKQLALDVVSRFRQRVVSTAKCAWLSLLIKANALISTTTSSRGQK